MTFHWWNSTALTPLRGPFIYTYYTTDVIAAGAAAVASTDIAVVGAAVVAGAYVFNVSINWVIPVFKKGARNFPTQACKTLEHIIHSHLMNHLERHNILSDHQHGFRKSNLVRRNSFNLLTTLRIGTMRVARSTLCCWTSQRRLTKCSTTIWQPNSNTTVCEGRRWNGWKAFWAVANRKCSWKGKSLHRPQLPQASHRDLFLPPSSSFAT